MFRFQCARCDEWHEGAPSLAFNLPDYCRPFSKEEFAKRVRYKEDMLVVDDEHYFIRSCLSVPIEGSRESFLWGLWTTVSRDNFGKYLDTLESGEPNGPYFSWLGNNIPGYPAVMGLKAQTVPRAGGERPAVVLEESDHPLSIDFHRGMPFERARALFERALHLERPS
jgi:hypothetical protein